MSAQSGTVGIFPAIQLLTAGICKQFNSLSFSHSITSLRKCLILVLSKSSTQAKYNIGELLTFTNPKVLKSHKVLNIPTVYTCTQNIVERVLLLALVLICLHSAGNPACFKKNSLHKNRTDFFMDDRELFMEYLLIELVNSLQKYHCKNLRFSWQWYVRYSMGT